MKEAAYKALYPDIKPTWKELTYLGLSPYGEKPTLSYGSPSQNSGKKFGSMHVSVSHDGDYTVAYVAVERELHSSLRFFLLTSMKVIQGQPEHWTTNLLDQAKFAKPTFLETPYCEPDRNHLC